MNNMKIKNIIQRPDCSKHFMLIRAIENKVEVIFDKQIIAVSTATKKIKEVGHDIYEPRIYIPREDVNFKHLQKSSKTSHCPLKGGAEYFNVIKGEKVIENAAWSYTEVLTFDERISEIKDYIAFDKDYLLIIEYPLAI